MALQATARFAAEHGELWEGIQESTGVIAAHTGMPRGLVATAVRCYADDAAALLGRHHADPDFRHVLRQLEKTRQRFPATTEDSQAGVLPNVIASRIAARYDLHGPTMAVDAGRDSTLAALRAARHYLGTGELDLVLVMAVNGNRSAENTVLAGIGSAPAAEGAFLLAVTTQDIATARELPVLAMLSFATHHPGQASPRQDCDYLAADHAVALLRAVESQALPARLPAHHTGSTLLASSTQEESAQEDKQQQKIPEALPISERLTRRYRKRLVVTPALQTGGHGTAAPPALPRRGVVLLASATAGDLVRADLRSSDSLVLELPGTRNGLLSPAETDHMLAAVDTAAPHLTVIGDLTGISMPRALALHDAVFLITQRLWSRWQPESSLAVLLGGAHGDHPAHPVVALFDGFVKSLRWERTGTVALTLTTDEPVTTTLLTRLAQERTTSPAPPPALAFLQGRRWVEALYPAPLPGPNLPADLPLGEGSVGVITGGAGDIVQELLGALAAHARPSLWLLGRTPAQPLPPELDNLAGGRDTVARAHLIRQLRAQQPKLTPQAAVAGADTLLKQHKTHLTLQTLRGRFGEQRVRYIACDIRDQDAVRSAVAEILRTQERVDFVIHAAGQVSSTMLAKKRLEAFRAARDTKVLGRLHLKAALGERQPSLWCNIGSYSGAAGAPGDTDYASGNAYLEAVAEKETGLREITIGFTMWRQTGMGSDALFQEHVSRQGQFTPISTAEGTAQFLEELTAAPRTGGGSTYLGQAERHRLRSHLPGLVRDEPPPRLHPAGRPWPAWRTSRSSGDSGEWAHPMDPEGEPHLHDHLVSGKPTVPATFILDLAAQAAEALLPDTFVSGFRDARFETFIRPFNRREPSPLRIRARLSRRQPDGEGRTSVEVSIHSDILGPDGLMRPGALRHFRTRVLLSRTAPPAPENQEPAVGASAEPAEDPYALPEACVSLRGPFRNLSHCSVGPSVARGIWTPRLAGYPGLRTMTTPALLMCAALRTSALRPRGGELNRPLFVPRAMARTELYTHGANDHDLLLRHGHELLVSLDAEGVYRAVTPTGRLLLEMSGVELVEMAA
jgi:NAD(P)-dependent dehydrogenase (short-subunit alcohol dehydrogenase family)